MKQEHKKMKKKILLGSKNIINEINYAIHEIKSRWIKLKKKLGNL